MMFFMFFFGLLLILAALWFARSMFGPGYPADPTRFHEAKPRKILDERYARGEITREQYEQMKQDLA